MARVARGARCAAWRWLHERAYHAVQLAEIRIAREFFDRHFPAYANAESVRQGHHWRLRTGCLRLQDQP